MFKGAGTRLIASTDGAVAPTVALSLFALIAAGGIAFDYARLASMDTELQQAADQAALAAATQLDGQSDSITRATKAAQSLVSNTSLFANDSTNHLVTVPTLTFYDSYDQTNDTFGTPTTSGTAAKVVQVAIGGRTANYALTPIVGMFKSGNIGAEAVAGIGTAICKTPPVMICNPQETAGNRNFDASLLVGHGLKLVSVGNGSGSWVPGNFGYLDTTAGSNGAPGLREALGWTSPPGDCQPQTGVNTKPGATVTVTDALNTRFDVYNSNVACPSGGACPASVNSVKDIIRPANGNANQGCTYTNNISGWNLPTNYYGSTATMPSSATSPLDPSITPAVMGHPRDMCHAVASGTAGACTGPIGDGKWDRDAYFRANYGWTPAQWQSNTGLSAATTRYAVYSWEIAHLGNSIGGRTVLGPRIVSGSGANAQTSYGAAVCSPLQGYGSGTVPGSTVPDRRRISVAVVNCVENGVNGNKTNVPVKTWLDLFLVEPSLNRARTNAGDVYAEVISETTAGGGVTASQVVRRDKPFLIR